MQADRIPVTAMNDGDKPTFGDRVARLFADEDAAHLTTFKWMLDGEWYKDGSSRGWCGEHQEGTIEAEHVSMALVKLVTGFGPGTTLENTPDWAFADDERPITLTIQPAVLEGER